jgi:Zn-dependent peptidase ImmA (M78 family)
MSSREMIETQIVRAALGHCPDPPVDLRSAAGMLGVGDIILADIWNGSTDFSYARPVVYLSRSDPEIKRRIIFAHELAHVMLRAPAVVSLIEARGQVKLLGDEEQLADRIALTLLLPDGWIRTLDRSRNRATRLAEMAAFAEVPLTALIRRMSAAGIDVAMLLWVRGSSNWRVTDRPGVPLGLQGTVKPSLMGHWAIENVGPEETDIIVDCRLNGRPGRIAGSGFRRGAHMVQVIQPSSGLMISRFSQSTSSDYEHIPRGRVS